MQDLACVELLLHLVELVCADCVQITPDQLLFQSRWVIERLKVRSDAQEVAFQQSVVLFVGQVSVIWVHSFLLRLLNDFIIWKPSSLSEIVRHCYYFGLKFLFNYNLASIFI